MDNGPDEQPLATVPVAATLRQLEAFQAVYDAGTYADAARKLRTVDTATVWRHVNRLERKLHLDLFERGERTDRVVASAYSHSLIEPVRNLLEASDRLSSAVALARGQRNGVLRISCYPAHIARFLAATIDEFSAGEFKDIRVQLISLSDQQREDGGRSVLRELDAGTADFAIAPEQRVPPERYRQAFLYRWRLVAVDTDSELQAQRGQVPISAFQNRRILVSPRRYRSRDMLEDAAWEAGFVLDVATESPNVEALLSLGEHSGGIPIVPDDALPNPPCDHWLTVTTNDHKSLDGEYFLWWLSPADPARVALVDAKKAFIQCAVDKANEMLGPAIRPQNARRR